jgi:hypothetical protein
MATNAPSPTITTRVIQHKARHNPMHVQSANQLQRWRPPEADLHMHQVKESLVNDKSKWKLQPTDNHMFEYLVLQLTTAAEMSNAVRTTKQDKQVWTNKWVPFCKRMGTPPWRDDHRVGYNASVKLRESFLFCFFYLHCINVTKPRDPTKSMCKPDTAAGNVRAIVRIFKRYGLPVVDQQFLKTIMKGMCNLYVERHGPEAFMPKRKQPLTVQIIYNMLNVPEGTSLGPLGKVVYGSLLWDSICAAFQFAAQTGARAAEIGTDKDSITIADYTFAHLQWCVQQQMHACPKPSILEHMTSLDYATVKPTVSKADQRGEVWVPFPMYLHYRSTAPINAARSLRRLELKHPPTEQNRETTALFRNNNHSPLTIAQLRTAFKHLIAAVLPEGERSKYSMHSFRIFLATALKDAGAENMLIQFLVRWQTEESLRTYCRIQPKTYGRWLDKSLCANIDPKMVAELPTTDHHDALQAAMSWADATDAPEQLDKEEQCTETVEPSPHFPVPSFTWYVAAIGWAHAAKSPQGTVGSSTQSPIPSFTICSPNLPNGVLYETVALASGNITPSREWVFHKPKQNKAQDVWLFTIGRNKGLQSKSNLPWGPPTLELTDVTSKVQCAKCGLHPHAPSTCKHTTIQVRQCDMPMHIPSSLPLQMGTQSHGQQGTL